MVTKIDNPTFRSSDGVLHASAENAVTHEVRRYFDDLLDDADSSPVCVGVLTHRWKEIEGRLRGYRDYLEQQVPVGNQKVIEDL